MKKVLIYSGTTEGKKLAYRLAKAGVRSVVCVATEYGMQVMENSELITVKMGRLTVEQMESLLEENHFDCVVDATHPYATMVTENIRKSVEKTNIPLYRLARNLTYEQGGSISFFSDDNECANALNNTEGRILLTTGSKELYKYCQHDELRKRLVVRVLPGNESIKLCYDNKLTGSQIIGMQGPFSVEMNSLLIREYNITTIVTKESGKVGGMDNKVLAAINEGIDCFIIRKPASDEQVEYSFAQVCDILSDKLGICLENEGKVLVTLAGIGMGDGASKTVEVADQIAKSNYIFGAKRMLEDVKTDAKKFPYYLAKDIIPVLDSIRDEVVDDVEVTVLFSGDASFFSGCEKMHKELKKQGYDVKILPGISSMSALSAKVGISWQDACIISTHGIEEAVWKNQLCDAITYRKKIFFISSGHKDVIDIYNNLKRCQGTDVFQSRMIVGYNLSYPDERIVEINEHNVDKIANEGLYCGFIINDNLKARSVTPRLLDDAFERDKVPMTKEDIRHLSVCKMNLKDNSVVYDIGSGTGSVSCEIAGLSCGIKVFAIEINSEAVNLTKKNVLKHKLNNVCVVEGMAPDVLDGLPLPDCVFVGGSKGNMKEIIQRLINMNKSMTVVLNAVSMESICEMFDIIKQMKIENYDITEVSVAKSRKLGDYNMLSAANPVFIFTIRLGEGEERSLDE